jgi:hypothetical protein
VTNARSALAAALLCALLASGCYRTVYTNFGAVADPPPATPDELDGWRSKNSWQHFFIWGWIPEELFVDARQKCGRADNIRAVETRRTFLEGLVAQFAGYYINIYSPYDAAVRCKQDPTTLAAPASAPPPSP